MTATDRLRRPRVAIVDDEEDITTYLGLALEDGGYEVMSCNEATQAARLLRAWRPDVICLDLLMPEEMGTSLYVALRRDEQLGAVPIIILSGLNARDELTAIIARFSDVPAPDGYMEKPIDIGALMTAVEMLAGSGRSVRA